MDYKSLMGYGEKKKVVKKESKPKVNKVLQSVKKDLKEWNDKTFKDLPRRWGGASDKGLTEYEKQLKEVGAGAQYRKFYKDIERQQQGLSKSVEKFKKYLEKQGLKSEATKLYDNYLIDSYGWMRKWLKKFIRDLM